MDRLKNKTAIITGSARGMGAATARRFVYEGAKVVIADVLDGPGKALAEELGAAARFQHLDVTDENSWNAAVEDAAGTFHGIDILVNNAGVLLFRVLADTSKTDFQRILNINLVGTFLGTRIVGAHMIERGHGSIINISSVDGMKGANGLGAYAASKWGIRGLTRVAAMEYGHCGVRVNSVHPGGVNTVMGNPQHVEGEALDRSYKGVPLQRIGRPDEIAATTLFLASDEASYLCGAEIAVDGGMTTGQYYLGLPGAPAA